MKVNVSKLDPTNLKDDANKESSSQNQNNLTLSQIGNNVSLSGELDKFQSFSLADKGEGKWIALVVKTGLPDITLVKVDGVALTQEDVQVATELKVDAGSYVLWLKADEIATSPHVMTLSSDGYIDKKVSISLKDTTVHDVAIKEQEDEAGYGEMKVSDLMQDDVAIAWEGTNGTVTGTFNYISNWEELPEQAVKSGHYFAMNIDRKYFGKPFEFIKGDAPSGTKTDSAGEQEMFWVLRIDDEKKFTFKSEGNVIAKLDFTNATLVPPKGKDAIIVPDQSRSFGEFGETSSFIGDDISFNWDGIKGTATGTIKYFDGNTKVNPGYHYPIIMNSFYSGKTISVNGSEKTDTDIIFDFRNTLVVPIKYNDEDIVTLDFTGATLKPLVGKYAVEVADQGEDMDAVKPASTLIDPNVEIEWTGNKGKVKGNVHWYKFTNGHFKDKPTGHYVPVVIKNYDGKTITAKGSSGSTVDLEDPKWIIRVDDYITLGAEASLACEGTTLATLNFAEMTLEAPVGENAVALAKEVTFADETTYEQLCNTDVQITWSEKAGAVTGTFLKKDENYELPLKFDDFFKEKTLTFDGATGTQDETDKTAYRISLGSDGEAAKAISVVIKLEEEELATLTFTGATFSA